MVLISSCAATLNNSHMFGAGSELASVMEHVRSWFVPNSITLAGSEPAPN